MSAAKVEDVPEERATESMVAADEASMEESEPSLQDAAEEAQTESSAQMKVDEKTDTTIPRLILPTKVYVSTVAQLKEEKTSKRSPSAERIATTTRPTQVPPLVFPLANMFEERMPLPMVPTNGGSSTTLFTPPPAPPSSSTASVSADNHNLTSPSWDPSENASRNGPVHCMMYHKIRGGKGEWREVSPWELIRVTKGVGKKVKMVVEAPGRFGPNDIHLSLTDMTDAVRTPRTPGNRSSKSSRFIIESTTVGVMDPETGKSSAELIIKLFKLSKQLVFQASVSVHNGANDVVGTVLRGQSAPFGTHNSGKQRRKREKEGEDDEEGDFAPHETHGSSSHSTNNHNNSTTSNHHSGGPSSGGSSSSAHQSQQQQQTSLYPRRRKQPKRAETDDDSWHSLPPIGGSHHHHHHHHQQHQGHHGGDHHHSHQLPQHHGHSEDLLDSIWASEDSPHAQTKEMVQQVNNVMREFGSKYLLEEARKRHAGIVAYVACRRSAHPQQSDDFTTFVYKQENLLKEDAITLGTPLGRALFIPSDERGDTTGVYTLVAAVRMGIQDMTFAPNSGIAAVYDFRRDGDHLMKTIPIQPMLLASEPTTVWLIGSFQVDARTISWLPSPHTQASQPTVATGLGMAGLHPANNAAAMLGYPNLAGGRPSAFGYGPGSLSAANGNVSNGSMNNSGVNNTNANSNAGGGVPIVPPLPLGPAPLAYPHLTVQYSPRGSLHSPSPYYAAGASAAGYLAPKPIYSQSPAPSPSSTPIPSSASGNNASLVGMGPATPGLGQTPRGFGDMLAPFGSQGAPMMSSGFYSPASYSQPIYMFDPSLLLSARGLPTDGGAGFYSPSSSTTSAASSGNSAAGTSLNLSQFKNASQQQQQQHQQQQQQQQQAFQQGLGYPAYSFFPGASGLQGGMPGFPGNSPRFEELLDSARM